MYGNLCQSLLTLGCDFTTHRVQPCKPQPDPSCVQGLLSLGYSQTELCLCSMRACNIWL